MEPADVKEQNAENDDVTKTAPKPPPRRRAPKLGRPKADLTGIISSKQNGKIQGAGAGLRFASPSNREKPEADNESKKVRPENEIPESPRRKPPKLGRPRASIIKVAQIPERAKARLESAPEGDRTAKADVGPVSPGPEDTKPGTIKPAPDIAADEEETPKKVQSEASKAAREPEAVEAKRKLTSLVSKDPTEETTGAAAEPSSDLNLPTKKKNDSLPDTSPAALPTLPLPSPVTESQERCVKEETRAPDVDSVTKADKSTGPPTLDGPPEQEVEELDGTRSESPPPKGKPRKLGPPKLGTRAHQHDAKEVKSVAAFQNNSGTSQTAQPAANAQISDETPETGAKVEETDNKNPESPRPKPKPRKLGRPKAEVETNVGEEKSVTAPQDNSGAAQTAQTAQGGANAQTSDETLQTKDVGNDDRESESPPPRPKPRKLGRPKPELESQDPKKLSERDERAKTQDSSTEYPKLKTKPGTTPGNSKPDPGIRRAKDAPTRRPSPLADAKVNHGKDPPPSPLRPKPPKFEQTKVENKRTTAGSKQTDSNDKASSSTPKKLADIEAESQTTKTEQRPKKPQKDVTSTEAHSKLSNDTTASPAKTKTETESPKPKKLAKNDKT